MPRVYTYGPFKSRRLGLSLGVDILPREKVCTYNCVYCEIGPTINIVSPKYRIISPPSNDFSRELKDILRFFPHLDSITFGYNGEPTLNENILEFYKITKQVRGELIWTNKPPVISLFTNSSTLYLDEIREKIKNFDYVIAKLDCVADVDFKATNRPHEECPSPEVIIASLKKLKKELNLNKLVIQSLIYNSNRKDFSSNNNEDNIRQLAFALKKIKPDMVQIYSIARIPSEPFVFSIDEERKREILNLIKKIIKNDLIQIDYY
jgi:wyosine [tRNA(Phe)-imidazoG37] synthetase (radical SAM superfamily)